MTQDNNVLVFHAPGQTIEFNPFVLYRTFYGAYDEMTCIDWTSDQVNNIICLTVKDMGGFKWLELATQKYI